MKYDKVMIETARIWAEQSYCKRRKVGAVVGKEGRILATGYNGTISGLKNECEDVFYKCPNCGNSADERQHLIANPIIDHYKIPFGQKVSLNCSKCNEPLIVGQGNYHYSIDVIEDKIVKESITNDFTVHAEQNVISYCAKQGIPLNGATMYITTSPCKQCAKLIAQSGITRVAYIEKYKDTSGLDFLGELGIETKQIKV